MPLKINKNVQATDFQVSNYKCVKQSKKRKIFIISEYLKINMLPDNIDIYPNVADIEDKNDPGAVHHAQYYTIFDSDMYMAIKKPSDIFKEDLIALADASWNWNYLLERLAAVQENTYNYLKKRQ